MLFCHSTSRVLRSREDLGHAGRQHLQHHAEVDLKVARVINSAGLPRLVGHVPKPPPSCFL